MAVVGSLLVVLLMWFVARSIRLNRLRVANTLPRDVVSGRALSEAETYRLHPNMQSPSSAAAQGATITAVGTAAHALWQYHLLHSGTVGAAAATESAEVAASIAQQSMNQFAPSVVKGASAMSARIPGSAEPSLGASPEEFMQWFNENVNAATDLGTFLRLKGYVGEQQLADALEAQGHTVEFASTANNPGWDLLVDGETLANAKTHMTVHAAAAEARAHPEFDYYVPTDATGSVDLDNVLTIEGYSNAAVHDAMNSALDLAGAAQGALETADAHLVSAEAWQAQADAAGDVLVSGDFLSDALSAGIPVTLVAFTAYRQVKAVRDGKPWQDAVKDGSLDIVVKGTGIMVGASLGGKAGAMVDVTGITAGLPIGTIVGGIAGAAAGSTAGAMSINWWKNRHVRAETRQLKMLLAGYGAQFTDDASLARLTTIMNAPVDRADRAARTLQTEHEADRHSARWWLWPSADQVRREQAAIVALEQANRTAEVASSHLDMWNELLSGTEGNLYMGLAMVNSPQLAAELGGDGSGLKDISESRQRLADLRAARRVG